MCYWALCFAIMDGHLKFNLWIIYYHICIISNQYLLLRGWNFHMIHTHTYTRTCNFGIFSGRPLFCILNFYLIICLFCECTNLILVMYLTYMLDMHLAWMRDASWISLRPISFNIRELKSDIRSFSFWTKCWDWIISVTLEWCCMQNPLQLNIKTCFTKTDVLSLNMV